ncbi:MAG: carotene hydroxylase [Fluviicola sp.]|jgi:beta-carotene 3-hydroxylase
MYWWGPLVLFGTFILMEAVAWLAHKYLMHGMMWYFHRDHHQVNGELFEKNDIFFLIFAVPSWLCIMLGMIYQAYVPVWIGFGIAVYGFAYFLVHDVFIHRRFSWLKQIDHPYFMAIRKAHKMHHKHLGKEDGECFGMLFFPWKYYREAKKYMKQKHA